MTTEEAVEICESATGTEQKLPMSVKITFREKMAEEFMSSATQLFHSFVSPVNLECQKGEEDWQ